MTVQSRTRRQFLRWASATAALVPFGRALEQSVARAAGETQPLRFIAVFVPHGVIEPLWRPGANFDLRYEHATLAPFDDPQKYGRSFRDQLIVVDGVDLSAGIAGQTVGHDAARVILTGSSAFGRNSSLDQYLAVEQGMGADTPLDSLVLGVGDAGSKLGTCISYARGGSPIPKLIDPVETHRVVFGASTSGDPSSAQRVARETAQRRASLDLLTAELRELGQRVPAAERDKLDQHATAFRELEKRLEPLRCPRPAIPNRAEFPDVAAFGGGEPYFDTITKLQIDLLVQALACDATRFATLYMSDLSRTGVLASLPEDIHNDVAHRYVAPSAGNPLGAPETWLPLAEQHRYSYGMVATLLQRLAEFELLEHTIVLVMSDMGDPARHTSSRVPTLIAGGAGGRFQMGRHLQFGTEGRPTIPNNRVLVSIARAFGVELDAFGEAEDPAITDGALEL
jgi:hypothetical protein